MLFAFSVFSGSKNINLQIFQEIQAKIPSRKHRDFSTPFRLFSAKIAKFDSTLDSGVYMCIISDYNIGVFLDPCIFFVQGLRILGGMCFCVVYNVFLFKKLSIIMLLCCVLFVCLFVKKDDGPLFSILSIDNVA